VRQRGDSGGGARLAPAMHGSPGAFGGRHRPWRASGGPIDVCIGKREIHVHYSAHAIWLDLGSRFAEGAKLPQKSRDHAKQTPFFIKVSRIAISLTKTSFDNWKSMGRSQAVLQKLSTFQRARNFWRHIAGSLFPRLPRASSRAFDIKTH
jgi:hypothetical protein